jgi:hypothetical protein
MDRPRLTPGPFCVYHAPMASQRTASSRHIFVDGLEFKRCTKCANWRPVDEFGKSTGRHFDGLKAWCKPCEAARMRAQRATGPKRAQERVTRVRAKDAYREWLWAEKSKPCERCGNAYHPVAMQFDHLPGFEKKFMVSMGANTRPMDEVMAERAKCQLLCSNCHHIVTWERKTGETVPIV